MNPRLFGKLRELFARVRRVHPATAIDDGFLGMLNESDHFIEGELIGSRRQAVSAQLNLVRPNGLRIGLLDIFGDIHQHGTGSPAGCDVESFFHDPRNVIDIRDQITVFDNRQRHPENVRFLECTAPDHVLGHLPRNRHKRHRIHKSIGNPRQEIHCSGATRRHTHTGFSRRAGITDGGKHPALLVAGKNCADPF